MTSRDASPAEAALRDVMWRLIGEGQAELLRDGGTPADVARVVGAHQRRLTGGMTDGAWTDRDRRFYAASLARDMTIGASFYSIWHRAARDVAEEPGSAVAPGWADYASESRPRHPEGGGRDLFTGAMMWQALRARDQLVESREFPDHLYEATNQTSAVYQTAVGAYDMDERRALGLATAVRPPEMYSEESIAASRQASEDGRRETALNSGLIEQCENSRIGLQALVVGLDQAEGEARAQRRGRGRRWSGRRRSTGARSG